MTPWVYTFPFKKSEKIIKQEWYLMLDQNTDRTYWMIGAVVVVAVLIGASKVAFPKLFNTVITKFTSVLTTGFAHFPIESLMNFF